MNLIRSGEQDNEAIADVLEQAETVRDALVALSSIRPLRPERYWSGKINIEEVNDPDLVPDVPVEANFKRNKGSVQLTFHRSNFEDGVAEIADERPQTRQEMLALYIGHAMMSELALRALPPRKTNDFVAHISMPNGLFGDLVSSGLIDESSPYSIMNEFFIGNEDRIPVVNVARFAVGSVYAAMNARVPGYQERVQDIFQQDLAAELGNADSYRGTVETFFRQEPGKIQEMFVEHIRWFNLAAAFPKHPHEIEDFVSVYL